MPHVRMKVEPHGSLAEFSKNHPDVELRIVLGWPEDDVLVSITEADTKDADLVLSFFDTASEVHSYEVLHIDDHILVIHALIENPGPHIAARSAGNLPRFPLIVRDGWIINERTTLHDRLARFEDELEEANIAYEVMLITSSNDADELLTDRQQQFVSEAIELGYYDNPRECSLTELAETLGVNKATASGILHRAESKIIKQFDNGSVPD